MMMLMIMLQIVNHLIIKKNSRENTTKTRTTTEPPQPLPNPDGFQPPRPERPPQSPLPALNAEVTIPLKYLSNFWKFLE